MTVRWPPTFVWGLRFWGHRPWFLPVIGRGYADQWHVHRWRLPESIITKAGRWTDVRWLMEARECAVDGELRIRAVRRLW